jgi:predicted metal-dependent hydrolase
VTAQADRQLHLFDARRLPPTERAEHARRLADALAALLSEDVRLTVHDNRSTMVSFRRRGPVLHYRLHHMFLDAPDEVLDALAAFARAGSETAARRREAGRRIDGWVRHHRHRIQWTRSRPLQPRGRAHDLQAIFDRVNAERFACAIEARIGWGPVRVGDRSRTVKTGVYLEDGRLIRIHPSLDRPEVPEFYVAFIVFHEMLHQAVPARERNGRRIVHGPEFRRRERAHPDFARALAWERRHIRLLLSSPA